MEPSVAKMLNNYLGHIKNLIHDFINMKKTVMELGNDMLV